MKFFAIHLSDLESERFLSASNDQIATWLFLHAYCAKQCNAGTITDAHEFSERFWSRHGIEKGTLELPSPLWSWEDGSLIIEPYDIDGQTLFERKSKGGKEGADKRWNRTPNRTPKGSVYAPNSTLPNSTQEEITKPKKRSSGDDREVSNDGLVFADWFKTLLPETLSLPKNWNQKFAKAYDDMARIDGRKPDDIRSVCQWARTNDFWKNHIMSPAKLRERKDGIMYFDKLMSQATPTGQKKGSIPDGFGV